MLLAAADVIHADESQPTIRPYLDPLQYHDQKGIEF